MTNILSYFKGAHAGLWLAVLSLALVSFGFGWYMVAPRPSAVTHSPLIAIVGWGTLFLFALLAVAKNARRRHEEPCVVEE